MGKWQKTSETAKLPESVSLAHLVARKLLPPSGEEVIYYQCVTLWSHIEEKCTDHIEFNGLN